MVDQEQFEDLEKAICWKFAKTLAEHGKLRPDDTVKLVLARPDMRFGDHRRPLAIRLRSKPPGTRTVFGSQNIPLERYDSDRDDLEFMSGRLDEKARLYLEPFLYLEDVSQKTVSKLLADVLKSGFRVWLPTGGGKVLEVELPEKLLLEWAASGNVI